MSEAPALPAVSRPIEARPALPPAAGVGGSREVPSPSPPSDVAAPAALAGVPDPVRQAASRAAEVLFGGREVEVDSFYDEGSGRAVFRVADRRTGEVLVETPPEELLRFFASSREPAGSPLVVLEA